MVEIIYSSTDAQFPLSYPASLISANKTKTRTQVCTAVNKRNLAAQVTFDNIDDRREG